MAVVIRLQGLPVAAGSADIRHFFSGLQIPDGGVHIIGGKLCEAFIVFTTDEDARRAMSRNGGVVKDSHVKLLLSSKTEMQSTLEISRKATRNPKHPAVPPSGDMSRSAPVKKGVTQGNAPKHNETYVQKYDKKEADSSKSVYISCFGLPYSATVEDVNQFFKGLQVDEIIFHLRDNGLKNGNALVKFGSVKDADAAMKLNNEYMGHRFISLAKSTEEKWVNAFKFGETHSNTKSRTRSRSPQKQQFYVHLKNLPNTVDKQDIRHFFSAPDMADSQIKFLLDKHNSRSREGFIMLKSERQYEKCLALSKNELKGRQVFVLPIARKAMLELIESYETQAPPKQRDAYVEYPNQHDSYVEYPNQRGMYDQHPNQRGMYDDRPSQHGMYDDRPSQRGMYDDRPSQRGIYDDRPSQRGMYDDRPSQRGMYDDRPSQRGMYDERPSQRGMYDEHPNQRGMYDEHPNQRGMYDEHPSQRGSYQEYPRGELSNSKRCVYLRNFPFDVSKAEVQKFFEGFHVHEDDIFLLFDNKGVGLGEALVRFQSENEAMVAEGLNRQQFLGTEVFLRCISDEQMKEFGAFNDAPLAHSQGYKDGYIKVPLPEAHENPMWANYNRKEFRGSPERHRGSYAMETGGRDESYGRFDGGNTNHVDGNNAFPVPNQNFEGRPSGAIIRMQNLPYTITKQEILDFFYGYNIIFDSIDIKFNRKGMSTGHASVCTHNYEEAVVAVNELSDRPIGSRKIMLSLTKI